MLPAAFHKGRIINAVTLCVPCHFPGNCPMSNRAMNALARETRLDGGFRKPCFTWNSCEESSTQRSTIGMSWSTHETTIRERQKERCCVDSRITFQEAVP